MDVSNLNPTHDPEAKSWVGSANDPATDFPVQNLPFGAFSRKGGTEPPRIGVAIGDQILAVAALADEFTGLAAQAARACEAPTLNALMAMGPASWSALRRAIFDMLTDSNCAARVGQHLVPMDEAVMHLPVTVKNYTDFYASVFHATNVGRLFRPENPLLPNYKFVPVGYHGRASSIDLGGAVMRPRGQIRLKADGDPVYAPCRRLDYETELGIFVGLSSQRGKPVSMREAPNHVFGFCLLNDWSARDIQEWEYQPLGPFLGKNFATSVSPWVVTAEALLPFRCATFERPAGDPAPLPYLADEDDRKTGGYDIKISASIRTAAMAQQGMAPFELGRASFSTMYWSVAQMIAHHTSNGCNLEAGDLLGSGTISGAGPGSVGCLLELTRAGQQPVTLPNEEIRAFLADGDEIILQGECSSPAHRRIGFGRCVGRIVPSG